MKKIIVFDNLVQQHSNGIMGDTQKVKARCSEEEISRLKDVSFHAKRAGEVFRKRFGLQVQSQ